MTKNRKPKKNICFGHAPTKVILIDNVNYYASSQENIMDFEGELVVNFTNRKNILIPIPEQLKNHLTYNFKEIMISWPDFKVPRVKYSFWQALHNYIIENKFKSVCLHCQAGHGRTGTALSALLISVMGFDANKAVDHIRENYCKEAVETQYQCDYLVEIDKYYNNRIVKDNDIPIPSDIMNSLIYKSKENSNTDIKDKIDIWDEWETYEDGYKY